MKEGLWGYWLIVLGLFVMVVIMLFQNYTTTSEQDEYLLREITDAALNDSVDYSHYTLSGEVRIIKELFVENFMKRFANTVNVNKTYKVDFYDIYEAPPKVSVKITSGDDTYAVMGDVADINVVNKLDGIIETYDGFTGE